jgi:glucose-6-phosphate 1-dehydrogenase
MMIGDQTLFMRANVVEQAWPIVQPVLDAWTTEKAGQIGDAYEPELAREGKRLIAALLLGES